MITTSPPKLFSYFFPFIILFLFSNYCFCQNNADSKPVIQNDSIAYKLTEEGLALMRKGDYQNGHLKCQEAIEIYEKTGYRGVEYAQVVQTSSIFFLITGDFQKAIDGYQNAREVLLSLDTIKYLDLFNNNAMTATCFSRLQNYQKADHFFKKSDVILNQKKTDLPPSNLAGFYLNFGSMLYEKGDLGRSSIYIQKALAVINLEGENVTHANSIEGSAYNNLYAVYLKQGELKKAEAAILKAIEIKKQQPQGAQTLYVSYLSLGELLIEQKKYDEGVFHVNKSIEHFKQNFGEEHHYLGDCYFMLSKAYLHQGQHQKALEMCDLSDDIYTKNFGPDHAQKILIGKNRIVIENNLGDSHSVEKRLNNIVGKNLSKYKQRFKGNNNTLELLGLLNTYFDIAIDKKSDQLYEKYHSFLLPALNLLDSVYLVNQNAATRAALMKEGILLNEKAIEIESRQANLDYENLFPLFERTKAKQLLEVFQKENSIHYAGVPPTIIEEEKELQSQINYWNQKQFEEKGKKESNDSLLNVFTNKAFSYLNKQEKLKNKIAEDYPDYYELRHKVSSISLSDAESIVAQEGAVALEYFVGTRFIYVFLIDRKGNQLIKIKKDFPLEKWVPDFLTSIYTYPTEKETSTQKNEELCNSFNTLGRNLFEKLIAPVLEKSKLSEKIIIIPDGVLGYLPFELLLKETSDRASSFGTHGYLIRDFQISYNYSLALLKEMQGKDHLVPQGEFVAFAPQFETTVTPPHPNREILNIRNELNPLEYNIPEAESINSLFNGTIFKGKQATESNFVKHAPNYKIIHLATHAKANDEIGDYSFLAFSEIKDSIENEFLFNRDLYLLDLNADMVVLSACETGVGELQKGEGIISLARGFSFAGAKSIITTLWSVNDQRSKEIMELFYAYIQAGNAKDEALRLAKLDFINKYSHDAHPAYWGGFISMGDMSPISEDFGWNKYYLFGGLVLLLLLLKFTFGASKNKE